MKKSNYYRILVFICLLGLAVLNQNCSGGFSSNSLLNSSSEQSAPTTTTTMPSVTTTTVPLPPNGSNCTLPWGGAIADGSSVTAYQMSTVAAGSTCVSETRNCDMGSLSGSFIFQSCKVMTANTSVPAQFANLLFDDATDYSANSSVWTNTPATVPAAGTCLSSDPTWKSTACRVTLPTDCPVTTANPSGQCSSDPGFVNDYSKVVPWSNDDSYFLGRDESGWLYLYRVSGANYTFIRRIQSQDSHYGATRDASNGLGIYGDASNWEWANNPSTPHILYYTGSGATSGDRNQLKAYNADTDTIRLVHDFSDVIKATPNCVAIDDEREGNASEDDRFWAFSCIGSGGDNDSKSVMVYDKSLDKVIATASMGANGICGTSACPATPNWIGMSPSGYYVIINWNATISDASWKAGTRGKGTEAFKYDLSYLGIIEGSNSHADVGYDVNGNEVYVTQPWGYTDDAYNEIAICNLANVSKTAIGAYASGGCQKSVQLPCSWAYDWAGSGSMYSNCSWGSDYSRPDGYTLSMRATRGAGQGYLLFSAMGKATSYSSPTNSYLGVGGWGNMENIAIKIDWKNASSLVSDATKVPPADFYRLGRTRSVGGGTDYWSQPNGVPNKSFTKFAWTSNWNTPVLNSSGDVSSNIPYFSFYTHLP
jgi:hypothetical protein